MRVMEVCVPHSSTHTNSSGVILPASSRQEALSCSSRSEAKRDFFKRPLPRQTSDGAAHRGGGDPHGVLVLECLAVLFEGEIGIGPKLLRQPRLKCCALAWRRSGHSLPRLDATGLFS